MMRDPAYDVECPDCGGTGQGSDEEPCETCDGTGELSRDACKRFNKDMQADYKYECWKDDH